MRLGMDSRAGAGMVRSGMVGAGIVGAGMVGAGVVVAGMVGAGMVVAGMVVAGMVGAGMVGAGMVRSGLRAGMRERLGLATRLQMAIGDGSRGSGRPEPSQPGVTILYPHLPGIIWVTTSLLSLDLPYYLSRAGLYQMANLGDPCARSPSILVLLDGVNVVSGNLHKLLTRTAWRVFRASTSSSSLSCSLCSILES